MFLLQNIVLILNKFPSFCQSLFKIFRFLTNNMIDIRNVMVIFKHNEATSRVIKVIKQEVLIKMAWHTTDYPDSFKNLETAKRKKAIEIANSLLRDGYDEGQAIPIAIEQSKKWFSNATTKERNEMIQASDQSLMPTGKADKEKSQRAREGQHVLPHEEGWAIMTDHGKQPSEVHPTKAEAVKRGKEIAQNKQTHLVIYKQDGTIQEKQSYDMED